ncbi:MAG: peptide chain release factor N(5)-glutamine methyltransferase [Rhodospirillales bacterium]|nr:peptide chain release factor N(5)-glutamine methyltransferase [Rhodospirillales bacterium]
MTMPLTIEAALSAGRTALDGAGVETATLDARLLLEAAMDAGTARIVAEPDQALDTRQEERYRSFLERRRNREPISLILGRRAFWKDEFVVTADTLTPRPDSETLIELAVEHFRRGAPCRILDLGTGTGCLLLSALREFPDAAGLGVDLSPGACGVALRNARTLGLDSRTRIICGDWGTAIGGIFDLILCNPPYIADRERETLSPEVREFEPRQALFAGVQGLDAYRELVPELAANLAPGGALIVEIGHGQGPGVSRILMESGFCVAARARDLANRERCLLATVAHT